MGDLLASCVKCEAFLKFKNSSLLTNTYLHSFSSYLEIKKSQARQNSPLHEEKNVIRLECKICFESLKSEESSLWILDCGHLPFCDKCSEQILNEGSNSKCPICRVKITDRKRAYF